MRPLKFASREVVVAVSARPQATIKSGWPGVKRAWARTRRQHAMARGDCTELCGRTAASGRRKCESCLAKIRANAMERRRLSGVVGLCTNCFYRPTSPGRKMCPACLASGRRTDRKQFLLRIRQRLCLVCGSPVERYRRCLKCRNTIFARERARRISLGLKLLD